MSIQNHMIYYNKNLIRRKNDGKREATLNILFVTQNYYPNGDATSQIVHNVSKTLISKGSKVDVVALTRDYNTPQTTKKDGVSIIIEFTPELDTYKHIIRNLRRKPFVYIKAFFLKTYFSAIRRLNLHNKVYEISPNAVRSYKKAVLKAISQQREKYDLIVVTLMPHHAVKAMLDLKTHIPIAVYQLDPYWNNDTLPEKYKKQRLEYEKTINEKSLFVLTTPIIYETNRKLDRKSFSKLIPSEFPMIVEEGYCKEILNSNNGIHCVFMGTLYPDIRPPQKIVEIIGKIERRDLSFDFYGLNQHLITESTHYEKAHKLIKMHGLIHNDEAVTKRNEANILVNIDNISVQQVPSKIIEYICTGKPIINFFFNKDSHTLEYLKDYPLVLNVNVIDTPSDKAAKLVEEFVSASNGKQVSWDFICKKYYKNTPEYVAGQILEALKLQDSTNK